MITLLLLISNSVFAMDGLSPHSIMETIPEDEPMSPVFRTDRSITENPFTPLRNLARCFRSIADRFEVKAFQLRLIQSLMDTLEDALLRAFPDSLEHHSVITTPELNMLLDGINEEICNGLRTLDTCGIEVNYPNDITVTEIWQGFEELTGHNPPDLPIASDIRIGIRGAITKKILQSLVGYEVLLHNPA